MRSVKSLATAEIVVKGSRFIALVDRLETVESFPDFLDKSKNAYPEATHYCYAYIIGDNQQYQKAYDDGEPVKTAGWPLLETIKKAKLTDVAVIVVRYFGGVKLGAGGLIRAYGQAARQSLAKAEFIQKKRFDRYQIAFAYDHLNGIDHCLNESSSILKKDFADNVKYLVEFDHDQSEVLISRLNDLTKGALTLEFVGSEYSYRS
jgi:uncharacterized YigZ family protein